MSSTSKQIGILSIILLIIIPTLYYGISEKNMNKKELTKDERSQLSDITLFNRTSGQGWSLSHRILNKEDLSGMHLNNAIIEDVDFIETKFSQVVFKNTVFKNVQFMSDTRFINAEFENVSFDNCLFDFTIIEHLNCVRCRFTNTKLLDMNMENSVYRQTHFQKFSDINGGYLDVDFIESSFINSTIKSEYYGGKLHKVRYIDTQVVDAGFSGMDVQNVSFTGGEFSSGFGSGTIDGLTFTNVTTTGMSFSGEVEGTNISLVNMGATERIKLLDTTIDGMSIVNSKDIHGPRLNGATLKNFTIENSKVRYFVVINSTIEGNVSFIDSPIQGMRIKNSQVNGLTLERSPINDFLVLDRAKFNNLKLINSNVEQGTEIETTNVNYNNSDKFPSN